MAQSSQLEWLEHFKLTRAVSSPGPRRNPLQIWERQPGELGSGRFGIVYLEKDVRSGKARAVKEISKLPKRDYKAELVALTRLSRPAYADYFGQFLGWYDDPLSVSLVMEYFELGDLRRHMRVPLPEHEAREITLQLLSGLQVMHSDGFTHRDLKPENIFVVQTGPLWQVKIGDFGVSKRIQHDASSVLVTQVGTVFYMAPEVVDVLPEPSDSMTYTNVVDTWAVGVVLYELLCASRPFPSIRALREYCYKSMDFPEEILHRHHVGEPATSLVRRLLTPGPLTRPDAITALQAEWFGEVDEDMAIRAEALTLTTHNADTQEEPRHSKTAIRTEPEEESSALSTSSHLAEQYLSDNMGRSEASTVVAKAVSSRQLTSDSTLVASAPSTLPVRVVQVDDLVVTKESISPTSGREENNSSTESWKDNNANPQPRSPLLGQKIASPIIPSTYSGNITWSKYPFIRPKWSPNSKLPCISPTASIADGQRIYVTGGIKGMEWRVETWMLRLGDGYISCFPVQPSKDPASPRDAVARSSAGHETVFVVNSRDKTRHSRIFLLDLETKSWRKHNFTRFFDGMVVVNGVFYCCASQENRLGIFQFNTNVNSDGTWRGPQSVRPKTTASGSEPSPRFRRSLSMVAWGRSLIIFGGETYSIAMDDWQKRDDIWRFDIDSRTWAELTPKPKPKREFSLLCTKHTSCVVEDAMYVFGGDIIELVKYDLRENIWFKLKPSGEAPLARQDHCMVAVGNRIFIFWGRKLDDARLVDDFECAWVLDLSSDLEWERL